jgi:hypothetical protein
MYQEDRFLPLHDNEYENIDNKKLINNLKLLDTGYGVIKKKVLTENGTTKNKKLEVYASGDTGSNIRDAITGSYYNLKVGSDDEDYFFKVRMSTGELKTKNNSTLLFFNTPNEYERYLNTTINQDTINKWEEKKRFFLKNNKNYRDDYVCDNNVCDNNVE